MAGGDRRRLFFRLWRDYLRQHLGWVLVGLVLLSVEGGSVGALSYLLQPMFDRIFVAREAEAIWPVGMAIAGLFAARALAGVAQAVVLTRVGQRVTADVQGDLVRHVLSLDAEYFQKNAPGSLIERVQGDVTILQGVWSLLLAAGVRDLVALVSLLGVAIAVDPVWTAITAVGVPILILPSLVVQRYVRRKFGALRELVARRTTRLDEIFHSVVPIKLNAMEAYQERRFRELSDRIVQASVKTNAAQAMSPALVDLGVGLGFFLVLVYGGHEVIAGTKTPGQFMSFFSAMVLAFQPLRRMGTLAGYYQTVAASLERIYAIFDARPRIADRPRKQGAAPARPKSTEVRFEDVVVDYGEGPVLDGLSFVAEHGRTTALVGPSGAGKSTVFNVLTRLVDPVSGRVLIGGVDVRDMPLIELRDMFSVVTQDSLLFDETLRENIILGREGVPDEALAPVLAASHVDAFLPQLPSGLDTAVGPRGSRLSGGQRQRVAIARALFRDAEVLLLDEATAALDARSEVAVQKAIDALSHGRTTLVIAHRLSTIRKADKIVVMDKGRVVEEGRHDDLMERGGLYRSLHDLQFRPDAGEDHAG